MKTRKLDTELRLKQKLITRGKGYPGNNEGKDGDFTVRYVSGRGLFFFYKWGNKWYSTRMSLYVPKNSEKNEAIIIPKGRKPRIPGELTTTNGKLYMRTSDKRSKQIVRENTTTGLLDINEIAIQRASTTSMGTDNGGTSDLKIVNTTGHAHAHIQTQGSTYDPYLIFSYLQAGETVDLKQWVMGMDNSDSDKFNWMYKSAGTEPLTPSGTTASHKQMSLDVSGNLTTRGTLTIGNITTDSAGDNYLVEVSGEVKKRTPAQVLSDIGGGAITALNNATENELVTVGATTTELDAEANLTFDGDHLHIASTGRLILGGQDTYIYESAADTLRINVGGDVLLQLSEKGDDGNEVHFGSSCAGFTQLEPTYNSSTTVVDFRHSNKQNLTFGSGNITNLGLYFPVVSGNFQLLIKQDGTGSRTVTNWKAAEFDESAADGSATVKWAGGSNPTLTTDANHVDILSFYWDADNEIAYGVATLDFQF